MSTGWGIALTVVLAPVVIAVIVRLVDSWEDRREALDQKPHIEILACLTCGLGGVFVLDSEAFVLWKREHWHDGRRIGEYVRKP